MLNITFIKYHLNRAGGLEKYSLKILDYFLEKGFKITLITTTSNSELQKIKSINYICYKSNNFFKFLNILNFDKFCFKWIKKNRPYIVFALDRTSYHSHTRLGGGVHKAYINRKKLFHSPIKTFFSKINPLQILLLRIEKKAFKNSFLKKVIVNSNMVKNEVIEHYNINPKKIEVLHNAVEYLAFEKPFNNWEREKKKFIEKLNLNDTAFHFVFIGNDYKRKGLFQLLKALTNLKNENFHLSILGKDKNIKKYKKYVKRQNFHSKVSFFGRRDDAIKFYQLADCLVIPSFYDPFANVSIEALAMGVKVLTSKYNGASEIITKDNGIIIDDLLDTQDFTRCLKKALKTKKNRKNAILIRNSVKEMDFSKNLNRLLNATIAE